MPRCYGNWRAMWDHTVLFPPLPQSIKTGTRFIDLKRMKGWVGLGEMLYGAWTQYSFVRCCLKCQYWCATVRVVWIKESSLPAVPGYLDSFTQLLSSEWSEMGNVLGWVSEQCLVFVWQSRNYFVLWWLCLFVCSFAYLRNHTAKLYQILYTSCLW